MSVLRQCPRSPYPQCPSSSRSKLLSPLLHGGILGEKGKSSTSQIRTLVGLESIVMLLWICNHWPRSRCDLVHCHDAASNWQRCLPHWIPFPSIFSAFPCRKHPWQSVFEVQIHGGLYTLALKEDIWAWVWLLAFSKQQLLKGLSFSNIFWIIAYIFKGDFLSPSQNSMA